MEVEGWAFINHIIMMMHYRIFAILKDNKVLGQYSVMDVISYFRTIQKINLNNDKRILISEMTKKEKNLAIKLGLDISLFKQDK